jgi:hypothetical protein
MSLVSEMFSHYLSTHSRIPNNLAIFYNSEADVMGRARLCGSRKATGKFLVFKKVAHPLISGASNSRVAGKP